MSTPSDFVRRLTVMYCSPTKSYVRCPHYCEPGNCLAKLRGETSARFEGADTEARRWEVSDESLAAQLGKGHAG